MLTLGIDDAGRGPVIGPMILAGVLINKDQEKIIKQSGATDSKLLYHNQRIRLSKVIKQNSQSYKIIKVYPSDIDAALNSKNNNLNRLEAQKMADVVNKLNKGKERIQVIIDCPSINITVWKRTLLKFLSKTSNLTIKCEHKADLNHTSAAAASILAKVAREEEIAKIREQYKKYGNVGSGYPSDPLTKEFLKNNGKELQDSGIFRKTWSTWKKMFPDKKQKTLGEF